jgi:serine/threonine-protein kinase
VVDTTARQQSTFIITGDILQSDPYALAVSPDGSKVYVPDHTEKNVAIIDARTNNKIAVLSVPKAPHWVTFDAKKPIALVADHESNVLSVINTDTNSVTPIKISVGKSPHSVAITPDGKFAYTANYDVSNSSVVNLETMKKVGNDIPVGFHPRSVAISTDGRHAYYPLEGQNELRVINTQTRKPSGLLDLGQSPWFIAIAPDGHTALVSNRDSGTVSLLSLV